ncbi:MAG: ABC transporter permease [Candidatus Nitrosocaldus sp.]|nr:ABC transporter permease [Candidatus Nitrosocaldus sp.]
MLNLKAVYARAYVRLKGLLREPHWSIAEVTIPLLSLSAYVYMYTMLGAPSEYMAFVVVGGAMLAFWSNVLWGMSAQLYWEKETGTLTYYLLAPASRMAILLGMAAGGALNTTLRSLSILMVGTLLFPVEYNIVEPVALLIVFLLTVTALYGMGMLFASLFLLYGREATHIADLLQEPIYLFSGIYYPVLSNQILPYAVRLVASIIPLTFGIDAIRLLLIMGKGMGDIMLHIVGLSLLIIVLMPLAYIALRRMEDTSKRHGRLTLRWQ